MPAAWQLDHINVIAGADASALTLFRDVMRLHSGPRPAFPFAGDWLYAGDAAVVHVTQARAAAAPDLHLHHVAFRTAEPASPLLQRVRASGLPHSVAVLPDEDVAQIFVSLPGGLLIELDAPLDEAMATARGVAPGAV
jgi:hypothetical protein